jgi:hypothetical protein
MGVTFAIGSVSSLPAASWRARPTTRIARGWLRRYLADEGVILAVGDPSVTRLFGKVTAMLNDIQTNLGSIFRKSASIGGGNTFASPRAAESHWTMSRSVS